MKESWLYNHPAFSELKRKIYLVVLPVLLFTFFIVFFYGFKNEFFTSSRMVICLVLFFGLSFCYLFLLVIRNRLDIVEIAACTIAVFSFLYGMYESIIHYLGVNGNNLLGPVSYWTPLLFIFFYFTFRGAVALIFSLVVFSFSVVLGFYHVFFSNLVNPSTIYTLIQYYFSSLATIIAINYFHRIIEIYLEAEVSQKRANTDYLTNLPNRRMLEQQLNEEIEKSRRSQTTLSVILFDIDHFKIVNDTYGHDVGDRVLKELSQTVRENIRDTDYFGRWGGEEFLVIATRKNLQDGVVLAERMRETIAGHKHNTIGYITCSFGVAELQKNEQATSIIKRADLALYKAKKNGRNQVGTN